MGDLREVDGCQWQDLRAGDVLVQWPKSVPDTFNAVVVLDIRTVPPDEIKLEYAGAKNGHVMHDVTSITDVQRSMRQDGWIVLRDVG